MLSPIRTPPKGRRFLAYDLEWIPADGRKAKAMGFRPYEVRLAGVFDGESFRAYSTVGAFLAGELTRENRGAWFYAHAGGSFDMIFLLEYLMAQAEHPYSVKCIFKGSAAVIVEFSRGKDSWTFVDSFFLIRTSLRKIGEWMGAPKGGEEGGTDIFYGPLAVLRDYNEQDCRILYAAIAEFERVVNSLGGQLELTVASTGLGLFRRAYLHEEIPTFPALNKTIAPCYVASRVEPLTRHVQAANYYDINSSFPHAMTSELPGRLLGRTRKPKDSDLYIAKATITVQPQHIPPLPYRTDDRRIYFPVGTWESWFTAIDIEHLLETGGRVESIKEALTFAPNTRLRDYAQHIYSLRRDSESEAEKQILKILLNSCYGKFAEGDDRSFVTINPDEKYFSRDTTLDPSVDLPLREEIHPGIWNAVHQETRPHQHIPFAAWITAIARRALGRYMVQASDCYYCDTDGFAVPPSDEFPTGNELGELKLEKRLVEGIFEAPKLYGFRTADKPDTWTLRAKGFSKVLGASGNRITPETHRLNYEDFCQLLEHKELPIGHFMRIKESLRGGSGIRPWEVVKWKAYRGTQRQKRNFAGGNTSRPWNVSELIP